MIDWKLPALVAALGVGGFLLFRSKSADASGGKPVASGGKCGDWAGDGKAIQTAINSALASAAGTGKPKTLTVDGKPGAMTCRAAEWLVAQKAATPEVAAFAASKKCGCGRKRAPCGIGGPTAPQSVRDAIVKAGVAKGYSATEVARAVNGESGWHAQAVDCQGADKHPVAAGLMGMLHSTLTSLGFDGGPDQFASLTAEEQLPYCLKMISKMPTSCLHRDGDFHLALFVPAFVCKSADTIIFEVGTAGWEQNPYYRTAGGGPITVASVLARG